MRALSARNQRAARAGFGSLALAYYIWRLGVARQFTAPESWLQGHAIWHLLTAASLGCLVIFYRSEIPAACTHPGTSQTERGTRIS